MDYDLDHLRRLFKEHNSKNVPCSVCLGVGCRPENFGQGNPDPKPCDECNGRGYIPRQLSML